MGISELLSKGRKKLKGEAVDVYTYDEIPEKLRVQIVHIIEEIFGTDSGRSYRRNGNSYGYIHKTLCKKYGLFRLNDARTDREAVITFLLNCPETEKVLDLIELSFQTIETRVQENSYGFNLVTSSPIEPIKELNERFKENRVGYQFESSKMIRIDSTLLHSEVVKPTLMLLSDSDYAGAQEEFLNAHEHYRQGRNKECLVDCLKSFESVIKTICTKRSWTFNQTDPAKKLIDVLFGNGLIPSFMQSQFDGLRALLESGVPTLRNKLAGHGQGATVAPVPNHVASYALHLTATNILFLVESEKALP